MSETTVEPTLTGIFQCRFCRDCACAGTHQEAAHVIADLRSRLTAAEKERDEWLAEEKQRHVNALARIGNALDVRIGETIHEAAARLNAELTALRTRLASLEEVEKEMRESWPDSAPVYLRAKRWADTLKGIREGK